MISESLNVLTLNSEIKSAISRRSILQADLNLNLNLMSSVDSAFEGVLLKDKRYFRKYHQQIG